MAAFTTEEIKLLDKMNKRLAVWQKKGVKSMAVQQVENSLKNFYEGLAGKDYVIKNRFDRFTMRKDLSDSEKKQLIEIAEMMEKKKTSSYAYYQKKKLSEPAQKAFEKAKKLYGISDSEQEYIKFADFMGNSQAIRAAGDMLGSKTIARIYGYGRQQGLSSEEIEDLILKDYEKFNDGDKFQNYLWDVIDEKVERKNGN